MSLMQLLSVGQSFQSIDDGPSPYRMNQQNLLPRFGAVPHDGATAAVTEQEAQAGGVSAVQSGTDETKNSTKKMTAIEAPPQAVPSGAAAATAQPYPLGRWTLIRNPFQRRTAPQKRSNLVQGEFPLDLVRPVRNDLSDADLEVVARQEAPPKVEEMPPPPSHPPASTGFLWSRLRLRLLKRA
jgi:hypothetical protein